MNRLIAVQAPVAPLRDVIVLSVELWTEANYVHLARLDTEEIERQWAEYVEAPMGALPPDTMIGHDLRLADDLGTGYEQRSGSSGGFPEAVWRAVWQFVPGPPETASRLTIANGDDMLELVL